MRKIAIVIGFAMLVTGTWFVWPGKTTGRTPDSSSAGPAPAGGAGEKAARGVEAARAKFHSAAADPSGSTQLRLRDVPWREPVVERSRQVARAGWEQFVASAKPTESQQQAILSAILDAQLYKAEVDRVHQEWMSDTARDLHGPFPDINWPREINEAVEAAAKTVLTPEQLEIFENVVPIMVAVDGQLVVPWSLVRK